MKNNRSTPLIIKKYENRRLYNTATSQYINQEQVAQLVRDGHDVQVIDVATGDDITRLILAQIVLDVVKTPESSFPLDVLRQMIVASGKATQDSALAYMKTMMEIYQDAYRSFPPLFNPLAYMPVPASQRRNKEAPPAGQSRKAAVTARESRSVSRGVGHGSNSELEELRRRVDELESALALAWGANASRTPHRKTRRKS